jgi:hypothetical protein
MKGRKMKRQDWMGEPMMMDWLEGRRMMSVSWLINIPDGTSNITDGTSNTIFVGAAKGGTSGRIGGIAVDPSDPSGNTIYVGSANGGVWK